MKGVLGSTKLASGGVGRTIAVGLTLVFLLPGVVYAIDGWDNGRPAEPLPVIAAALVVALVHLRHAFAAMEGRRPSGWQLSSLALLVAVYLPIGEWEWNWVSTQWFVIASALILLRPRKLALAAAVLPMVGTSIAAVTYGLGPSESVMVVVYWLTGLSIGGGSLYGSVRLVGVLDELSRTRAELAETAIEGERERVSRDLHDFLGQSLSAVSLKGDLALALLARDPDAARAEIEDLTGVAREALRGVRAVAHDDHSLSLENEVDGALALLAAAGVRARADVDAAPAGSEVEQLLAWAVREGVTNIVRHSDAQTCAIVVSALDDAFRLEMTNDGVHGERRTGTGLAGLESRARSVGGVLATDSRDGRFSLSLLVPSTATAAVGGEPA